jgi:hypothetical protein
LVTVVDTFVLPTNGLPFGVVVVNACGLVPQASQYCVDKLLALTEPLIVTTEALGRIKPVLTIDGALTAVLGAAPDSDVGVDCVGFCAEIPVAPSKMVVHAKSDKPVRTFMKSFPVSASVGEACSFAASWKRLVQIIGRKGSRTLLSFSLIGLIEEFIMKFV